MGYKILGRRGSFLLRNFVSSTAYWLGISPKPSEYGKEEGISALVISYNDNDWLEPSLLSVNDLVEEYIVIDSSTDDTPKLLKEIKKTYGLNMKIIYTPPGNVVRARNLGLKNISYKWVLIWDPDFIAMDHMPRYLKDLFNSLSPERHYLIYWPHICLDGDLFHYKPGRLYHIEHWLFTWSPLAKYFAKGRGIGSLLAPLKLYKPIFIRESLSFHLRTVRDPVKLLYKKYWKILRARNMTNKYKLEDFVKERIKKDYGTIDVKEAAIKHLKELLENTVQYDKNKYYDYPTILKEYVSRKYGIKL